MSINLLQGKNGKQSVVYTLNNNRKSAFWVLVYIALRYLKHDMLTSKLYRKLLLLFDDHLNNDFGQPIGGEQKDLELPHCAKNSCCLAKFKVLGLNNLLIDLARLFLVAYKKPSAKALERYKARLAKWGEVDEEDAMIIYKAKLEYRANPKWLYKTLHHYANLISLPTRPSASLTEGAESSSCCNAKQKENSPTTIYNFYQNIICSPRVENSTEKIQSLSLFHLSRFLSGMSAHPFNSQPAEDNSKLEPEAKRIKMELEEF